MLYLLAESGLTPDVNSYNPLIEGYCKTKQFDKALRLFEMMDENDCEPDLSTYYIIIRAFCVANRLVDALELFKQMKVKGIIPEVRFYRTLYGCLKDSGQTSAADDLLNEMAMGNCEQPEDGDDDDDGDKNQGGDVIT